ncbi:MAG: class I SAM-dependent methyltransferase [SAR202 cluster bacterium]|nr:class I SAM-dependent methyltransferase [SAR202 cluster bacterium]MDP6514308.1 class I SAM-dependent methyltransferase [SAR202 cluster bacterium]MDP6715626.1 class I SAM-dependent methyltransferase [SAR202 cluster bacterium]
MSEEPRYAFGDSTLADRRLALLAQVFEPSSSEFIRKAAAGTVGHVIDLGCGPGYSSQMLANAFPSASVIGLDISEQFIRSAQSRQHGSSKFYIHDVTNDPPPGPPANLMYARYLLTHISDPAGAISRWLSFLSRDGRLLIEENQNIETENPVFVEYLDIMTRMLAGQSNNLYLGPSIGEIASSAGLNCAFDHVTPVRVSDRDTAGMFRMNIETWQHNPFVVENYSHEIVLSIMSLLDQIRASEGDSSSITFNVRQLAFGRE